MGNVQQLVRAIERLGLEQKAGKERESERYARIVIKLDEARYVGTDIELAISGDYLGKILYSGDSSVYLRLNHRHASPIYATELNRIYSVFNKIYLTNPSSQSGKELIILVGGALGAEIEVAGGGKTALTDSVGADINPSKEDGNLALIASDADDIRASIQAIEDLIGLGDVYVNTHTMVDDNAYRFETTTKILYDFVITIKTQDALLGTSAAQTFPLAADASWGGRMIDLSKLYIKNAGAGSNTVVHIIGSLSE